MGYIFDYKDTLAYERWLKHERNSLAYKIEINLMLKLLKPSSSDSVVDIGCGAGASTIPLINLGLQVTGVDPSPYMLDIAKRNICHRADFYQGVAEDLPFEDNAFNHAVLFTSLEFTENHEKSLAEAFRVAKDRVFIGVLNKHGIGGIQQRIKGLFEGNIYNNAHFFSIWELTSLIKKQLGNVPIAWRTAMLFPAAKGKLLSTIEQSALLQRSPCGTFIGLVVHLVPRFRVRPLLLKTMRETNPGTLTGFAQNTRINCSRRHTNIKPNCPHFTELKDGCK